MLLAFFCSSAFLFPFPPQCLHTTNLSIISSESRPTGRQSHWLCFNSRQGQELSALAFATGAPVQGREPQVTTLFVGPETAAPTTLQPLQPRCSPQISPSNLVVIHILHLRVPTLLKHLPHLHLVSHSEPKKPGLLRMMINVHRQGLG